MKVGDLVKETAFDYEVGLIIEKDGEWLFQMLRADGKVETIHKDYLEVISESR